VAGKICHEAELTRSAADVEQRGGAKNKVG
jgi:hypothetical protein